MNLHEILYSTILNYQLRERLHLSDQTFDGFEVIARTIGHKSSSTLRKMCVPRRRGSNVAKLGYEEAMIIMKVTGDYRLLYFMVEELRRTQAADTKQIDLFCEPIRNIDQIFTERI